MVAYKTRKSFLPSHRMWLHHEWSIQPEIISGTEEMRQEHNYGFCFKQQS